MVAGLGLTACDYDEDPKLQKPTEFVLNTPPMADQVYYFGQDATGKPANDITFTVSQPDYGVGVTPDYTIQIARSEEDFLAWDEAQKAPEEEGTEEGVEAQADELPLAVTIDQTFQGATITVPGDKFCEAVNTLFGFERNTYKGEIVPVYVRAHAQVGTAEYSAIWSNPIKLAGVQSYFKLVKGKLYVVGACTKPDSWNKDKEQEGYFLEETEIGSGLYRGKIEVAAGEFTFRFYSELGDWDKGSIGPAGGPNSDSDVNITDQWSPVDGYTGDMTTTKDKFHIENWAGGFISIEVDLNITDEHPAWTVKMTPPEPEKVWVVGQCQGWNIDGDADYVLYETAPGSGIFENTISINAGDFTFKLYSATGDWDANHYGAKVEDEGVDITFTDGVYDGPAFDGKGNWSCPTWAGGKVKISLNTETMRVTFTEVTE